MYSRLLLNLCERSLYRASSSVGLNVKRLSHVVSTENEEKRQVGFVSEKYPDYKVIYVFPFIKQVCSINVTKRRLTKLTGAATPVIVGLHLAGILSPDVTVVSISCGVLLTIWLHSLGILCNNLVGYIYLKLDEEKAILSYIDYWGKRVDLETPVNEITPVSDNPVNIIERFLTDPLYKKITFSSQKQNLKINMRFGRIVDAENFKCILGTI